MNDTEFVVYRHFEEVLKCKWMLAILGAIRQGITRPGALRASIQGLTKKVLYERLHKLERFGIIRRELVREKPPEVHYLLTPYGERFIDILAAIDALQRELLSPP